ncbi:MAG TPA: site-2 protease family protein [Vicinamibacteria bacterium]
MTPPVLRPEPAYAAWPEVFPLPPPRRSFWDEARRPAVFLLLTLVSVFWVGANPDPKVFLPRQGLLLVVGLMPILMAHEMGHYLACQRYGVSATLPYFIPFPLGLVGTLGAFIRIRTRFPNRRALFDIGIAGPLAGFVVCLPMLVLGLREATIVPNRPDAGISLGEPLLFQWAARVVLGNLPDTVTVLIGPVGMAAWFGLLVTALNMMPIGQLDGGHVTYALLRGRAQIVSRLGILACFVLVYLRPTWLLWSILMVVLRRPHPPTIDDEQPLGTARVLVGILGFAIFAICFTPSPIYISWSQFGEAMGELWRYLTSR